jgi:hypothetical protein
LYLSDINKKNTDMPIPSKAFRNTGVVSWLRMKIGVIIPAINQAEARVLRKLEI